MYLFKNRLFLINFLTFLIFILLTNASSALPLDYDGYLTDLGAESVVENEDSPFFWGETPVGELTVNVYKYYDEAYDDDVYLYALKVDPGAYDTITHNISIFSTQVSGTMLLNNHWGYSFIESLSATGKKDAFLSGLAGDRLTFIISDASWTGDDVLPITFFYESLYAPNIMAIYGVTNSHYGEAINWAPSFPIPEPGTMALLLTGFGCSGIKFRNFFGSNKAN